MVDTSGLDNRECHVQCWWQRVTEYIYCGLHIVNDTSGTDLVVRTHTLGIFICFCRSHYDSQFESQKLNPCGNTNYQSRGSGAEKGSGPPFSATAICKIIQLGSFMSEFDDAETW